MSTSQLWDKGLKQLGCHPNEIQFEQLEQYVAMLERWNKTYNLTAVRNPNDMIPLHIFDSLSVAKYLVGTSCLDVGSGGGLPTIPLAIIQPDCQFTALDTNGKKTRFIQQVVIELGLKNVKVQQVRVENWQPEQKFNAIISRAFASVHDFIATSSRHLIESGVMYAMKGQFPSAELQYLPKGFKLKQSHTLNVPFVEGERHLLEISRD